MATDYIKRLALNFRSDIKAAYNDGLFANDINLKGFPKRSCGDVSCLLAEYLYIEGYDTIWCSFIRNDYTPAWLVLNDEKVNHPQTSLFSWPEDIKSVLSGYGMKPLDEEIETVRYEYDDLRDGLIIDITAD